MKFDSPAGPNPIDAQRVVGHPHERVDGPLKVAGQARYSYEYHDIAPNVAYGYMRGAGIGHGRIAAIDTAAAEAAPGVLLVMTYQNAPKQTKSNEHCAPQLQGPEIHSADQSVAFVVAESFEQARAAAASLRITYDAMPGRFDLAAVRDDGQQPKGPQPADTAVGNFDTAFADAAVTVDATYTTPDQAHSMMEPHASLAIWQDDQLTLYTSQQILHWAHQGVADTIGVPADDVRIVSSYVGGGFGSKLTLYGDPILAALAARQLGRPVKVALTRPQIYNHTSHRPATIQRLRIGATPEGRITAIGHECWSGNLPGGRAENATFQTRLLYAGENRMTRQRLSELDLPLGASMRAPGEAVGLLALESAMDELAEKLRIDPVQLRIINDTPYDPEKGPSRPFSSRHFAECLRTGAEKFGWTGRNPQPGQRREGEWLIGLGVAGAIRNSPVQPSGARVRLGRDGLIVETAQTDIGTGSYTILTQVAAEMLGLPLARVSVRLADTAYPRAAGSGGSFGANSSSTGLFYACQTLRDKIAAKAEMDPAAAQFADGRISAGNRSAALAELAADGEIVAEGDVTWGDMARKYAQASFGAHFCEAAVDRFTGEIRVRRMLSVCTAGRILNPRTARSQCLGGMTMGIGSALMEQLVVDTRHGYFVNHDMAEYQVPVHADIPALEVVFLDELDDKSSPIKAKGLGELGICGVGAAVANAVYNACGVRVREFPITLDKILPGLPLAA